MARAQSRGVDLADREAGDFFNEVILAASLGPKKLWSYSKSGPADWKKAILWADVKRHRATLSALLDRTAGRMLKAKAFFLQLEGWLCHAGFAWSSSDIERCCFSLRCMLSHLRAFCRLWRKGKKLPQGCECFQPVLRKIVFAPDEVSDAEADAGDEDVFMVPHSNPPPLTPPPLTDRKPRVLITVSSDESSCLERDLFGSTGAPPNDEAVEPDAPLAGSEVGQAELAALCAAASGAEPPLPAQDKTQI